METRIDKEDKVVTYINCITGRTEQLIFKNGTLMGITEIESSEKNISFIGTGLIYTCFTNSSKVSYAIQLFFIAKASDLFLLILYTPINFAFSIKFMAIA